jgi:hypothetical protein
MYDFDDFDGIDCDDWMSIGPMSEDIAKEKRDRNRALRDMLSDDDGPNFNDEYEFP